MDNTKEETRLTLNNPLDLISLEEPCPEDLRDAIEDLLHHNSRGSNVSF